MTKRIAIKDISGNDPGLPFYVYIYRDPRPDKLLAPIYVGKGTRRRVHFHWIRGAANPIFSRTLAKIKAENLEPAIEVVFRTDDESAAMAREVALIAQFGRLNIGIGTLCNLTDGGEGVCGRIATPETRARLSAGTRW